jgi:hypothetical protein
MNITDAMTVVRIVIAMAVVVGVTVTARAAAEVRKRLIKGD